MSKPRKKGKLDSTVFSVIDAVIQGSPETTRNPARPARGKRPSATARTLKAKKPRKIG